MKLTLTDSNERARHFWDTDDIEDIGVFEALIRTCEPRSVVRLLLKDALADTIKKDEDKEGDES